MENPKRIYVTRRIPEIAIEMLKAKGYQVDVGTATKPISSNDINKILEKEEKKGKGYNALITLLTDKIDSKTIVSGKSLKIVSNYAMGYDNIDVKALVTAGVAVTNAPGNYTDTIAEHVIALILSITSRIAEADRYVRKGTYKGWDPMIFIGSDLSRMTIGLIGVGRIGERVAYQLSKGFNVKIVYYDIQPNEKAEQTSGALRMNSIDELLKVSDIVSLHVPLLPTTHHMVNAEFLTKMKDTSFLINTSRGAVVDEAALVSALKAKKIAGAAVDVYEFEPKLTRGLTSLENIVLTPHIASASEYARNEMARVAAQNVIDIFENRKPFGEVLG